MLSRFSSFGLFNFALIFEKKLFHQALFRNAPKLINAASFSVYTRNISRFRKNLAFYRLATDIAIFFNRYLTRYMILHAFVSRQLLKFPTCRYFQREFLIKVFTRTFLKPLQVFPVTIFFFSRRNFLLSVFQPSYFFPSNEGTSFSFQFRLFFAFLFLYFSVLHFI